LGFSGFIKGFLAHIRKKAGPRYLGHGLCFGFSYGIYLGAVFTSQKVKACPAALFGQDLLPQMQAKRQELVIYSGKYTGVAGHKSSVQWTPVPLQVDPIDQQGHIDFTSKTFLGRPLVSSDLIMFRTEAFGDKIDLKRHKMPCSYSDVFEMREAGANRFAYLTNCLDKDLIRNYPQSVSFNKKDSNLETRHYLYEFNSENFMQFNNIYLRRSNKTLERVAKDSKLVITSDVKNFFTLHFDSKQIESKLEDSRLGPIANLARLTFFLRILFFKLDMSLSTDVAFFEDSGHIPMMINLPVDSFKYLNPKSGILYTWVIPNEIDRNTIVTRMPALDVGKTGLGWKNLSQMGLAYCRSSLCQYSFGLETAEKSLTMKMEIKRSLVEKGFFPQYVGDVNQFREAMDWDIETEPGVRRLGMYFEFSGLPKGGHPWNFWLKMNDKKTISTSCPVPMSVAYQSQLNGPDLK
jgi:hypothetical protein